MAILPPETGRVAAASASLRPWAAAIVTDVRAGAYAIGELRDEAPVSFNHFDVADTAALIRRVDR